jgi:hypothetical protein
MAPTDAELATQTLIEEGNFRFASFSASDAVTLVGRWVFSSNLSRYLDYSHILSRVSHYESDSAHRLATPEAKVW